MGNIHHHLAELKISFWLKPVLVSVLALLFSSAVMAQSPPSPPNTKGFCCKGPVFGVFDLSGTWESVTPHNPPVGAYQSSKYLYEGTENVGRILYSVNLQDQVLHEPVVTGGQEAIQTYTGTFIETWWEQTNASNECLLTPQGTKNMCHYVHRYASYDMQFSVRWCKALKGFVFKGLVEMEMNLQGGEQGTNSRLTIPEYMRIDPVAGEFCPTVDLDNGGITYDYLDNMIVSGFGPGGSVTFSTSAPNPYDEVTFRVGDRVDCWCEGGGTNLPGYGHSRKIGPADVAALSGTLRFTIASDLPLDLVELPFHPEGEFNLLKQDGPVRSRLPGETDIEWNTYLDGIKEVFSFVEAAPIFDNGEYTYSNIPLFDVRTINGRDVILPARYTLRVRGLNVEEYVTGSNPLVSKFTLFSGADAFNLQAGDVTALVVTPLDAIPIKKDLISVLSLMSPTRYIGPENLALAHVNALEAGSPTPSELEGLKRAILAERVARDGGRFGEQQIKAMLTGLNNVLGSLIDDLFSKVGTGKALKEKEKRLDNLSEALDPQALQSEGWASVPVDKAPIEAAMKKLVDDNFDLKISQAATQIKAWLGVALAGLKDGLIAVGLDEENAELISTVVSDAVNTVLDVVITQGVGALQSVTKEAVKFAINSAQNELFDTLPSSYTDITDEALDYSYQQLAAWAVDDDAAFRTNRRQAESELIQMGIDAYSNLGAGSALSITSEGFAFAETTLEPLKDLPVFGKAKTVAKVGKYLTGAASFIVPLKGAFWDTPARVEAGVARSYGQLPEVVFPAAIGALAEPPAGVVFNGLGNFLVNPLRTTLLSIRNRITALENAWGSNNLTSVLNIMGSSSPTELPALLDQAEKDAADVLAMAAAYNDNSIPGSQMQNAFVGAVIGYQETAAEVRARQLDLLTRVLGGEFTGPTDPRYLARRTEMLTGLDRLDSASDGLKFAVELYRDVVASLAFGSAVVVSDLALVSDSTSEANVSLPNETFVLSARIRNLGRNAVSGVEAELSLPGGAAATILSTAIQVPGTGALVANDGVAGSGSDEGVVSWQIQFTGSLDEQSSIPLTITSRTTAVNDPGVYSTAYTVLSVDATVFDPDGDGLPTAWETANGLNTSLDDADVDAEPDGLSNAEEFELGTLAQVMDSDNDGVNDGDEITGVNGWVTNPALDDTDGDGVLDGADGAPLDPTTSMASAAPEPVVAVGSSLVVLNEEVQQATVDISNAGTGTLIWTSSSSNSGLVITGNPGSFVQAGPALTLQLAPGLDIAGAEGQTVQVRVRDVAGVIADEQLITVSIGAQPELIYMDGFE